MLCKFASKFSCSSCNIEHRSCKKFSAALALDYVKDVPRRKLIKVKVSSRYNKSNDFDEAYSILLHLCLKFRRHAKYFVLCSLFDYLLGDTKEDLSSYVVFINLNTRVFADSDKTQILVMQFVEELKFNKVPFVIFGNLISKININD